MSQSSFCMETSYLWLQNALHCFTARCFIMPLISWSILSTLDLSDKTYTFSKSQHKAGRFSFLSPLSALSRYFYFDTHCTITGYLPISPLNCKHCKDRGEFTSIALIVISSSSGKESLPPQDQECYLCSMA